MDQWPHAPIHKLDTKGVFMVTAGTYLKAPLFNTSDMLDVLQVLLMDLSAEYGWTLQAWAIFPNHYHFLASSPPAPHNLPAFVRHLHSSGARELNRLDGTPGRRVWFQYWDSRITFEGSHLARLKYVHHNAVHHGVVRRAEDYRWCSAAWFAQTASPALRKTVSRMKIDRLDIQDDF